MRIRCVAGLGNPGPRYEWTRHNAGFWVVDRLGGRSAAWRRQGDALEAEVDLASGAGEPAGGRVVLLKPMTYMNRSGEAVREALGRHALLPEEILVVVDDAALPVGRLRLRASGSSGGHRGLASIEEAIGATSYPRLRIGVGAPPEGEDLADYLLEPIATEERGTFEEIAARAAAAVHHVVEEGLVAAMNRANAPVVGDTDSGGS